MLTIKEWTAQKDRQLGRGHLLKAGENGYIITLFVCKAEAACLPQAIQACFTAARAQTDEAWKPPFLCRLWHAWFGRKKIQMGDSG